MTFVKGAAKALVVALFAGLIAAHTLGDLVQTQIKGIAGTAQEALLICYDDEVLLGRSSNGRTADSGSAYRGSNPCLPANSHNSLEFS